MEVTSVNYGAYGALPPVGGPFACPGCLTGFPGFPGFNPAFGKFGAIPPFPGFGPYNAAFGAITPFPGFGPLTGFPGYNPFIGTYPGICTGCV